MKKAAQNSIKIAVLPGDGVGPEVVPEAMAVTRIAARAEGIAIKTKEVPCGGRYWQETGQEWPDGAFETCRDWADAILLGAVGWPGAVLPNGDLAGGGVLFGLRFGLDLFANVRPAKLYPGIPHHVNGVYQEIWAPENVDMVLIRENTEGCYAPVHGQLTRGGETEVAVDSRIITRKGSERVIRFAFQIAKRRKGAPEDGVRRVTCIDKANVMAGCRLFRSVFGEVAEEFPGIEKEYYYVDAFMQALVRRPEHFDVAVSTNMLGDIATDLAAVLQGGMGVAPSGEMGANHALFEGVHGSAPDLAGQGVANPLAAILSAAMMLEWLGRTRRIPGLGRAARRIETAVRRVVKEGKVLPGDLGGQASTRQVGLAVQKAMK